MEGVVVTWKEALSHEWSWYHVNGVGVTWMEALSYGWR